MSELIDLIKLYAGSVLLSEDGEEMTIELMDGATIENIVRFEKDNALVLPAELRELLLFSNGLDLFELQILSLEEMEFFRESEVVSFHNWGNGDFDCLSIGGDYPVGSVVFMMHSEDKLFHVSNSLQEWFAGVIQEIKREGTLLHPLDYNERESNGIYKMINTLMD